MKRRRYFYGCRFLKDERGGEALEYALVAAVVVLSGVLVASRVGNLWIGR